MSTKFIPSFVLWLMFIAVHSAVAQYSSREFTPAGKAATIHISTGDSYGGLAERHSAKITVLQIVRGNEAWNRIRQTSSSNPPPTDISEYLLARIKFEFNPGQRSGSSSYLLRESRFTALSGTGMEYDQVSISIPKPNFNGKVYSGESLTGWIVFLVAKNDKKPIMAFNNSARFQLY